MTSLHDTTITIRLAPSCPGVPTQSVWWPLLWTIASSTICKGLTMALHDTPEYKHCFLLVNLEGTFKNEYIRLNNICDSYDTPPEFVVRHECKLNQKQKLTPESVHCFHLLCFLLLTDEVRCVCLLGLESLTSLPTIFAQLRDHLSPDWLSTHWKSTYLKFSTSLTSHLSMWSCGKR